MAATGDLRSEKSTHSEFRVVSYLKISPDKNGTTDRFAGMSRTILRHNDTPVGYQTLV